MGRIERLVEQYRNYIALPWQKDLAGAQKAIFIVYDKLDDRRLRARKGNFEIATRDAGHNWVECDLTSAFAEWMAKTEYRDSYFEQPEDLALKLEDDFLESVAAQVRSILTSGLVDEDTVVGIFGIASLFGFIRVSKLLKAVESYISGRIVVLFPGEYSDNNYRLLDARDGWNYLAVPITLYKGATES